MKLLRLLLFSFFYCSLFDFVMCCLGFIFYELGYTLHCSWISTLGHKMVAMGSASFNVHSRWIEEHCCLDCDCSNCKFWTCGGWHKKD